MNLTHGFFCSSIGRKWVVALTGIGLFGFLIVHLSGNLLVFVGPEAMNRYAMSLHDLGPGLWVLRIGLLAVFLLHVGVSLSLARDSNSARPVPYIKKRYEKASIPSRYMVWTGLTVFAFILYHLAHYTFHWVHFTGHHVDNLGRPDVFKMVVMGFQNPWVSLAYLFALFCLAMHLKHGLYSLFQTLGLNPPKYENCLRKFGCFLAILLFFGYSSIPLSILFGFVGQGGAL